jgi:triacylglycerol lipase
VKEVVCLIDKEFVGFDVNLAMFLAAMSYQAYQFVSNRFFLPNGYHLLSPIHSTTGDVFGFVAESIDTIVVVFSGTSTLQHVDSYLNLSQITYPFVTDSGKTHLGITQIYQSCRKQLIEIINTLSPAKRFFVTGHSLGGSLGALFALDAVVNTPFERPILYTFASIPLGDFDFVKRFQREVKNTFRVINVNDYVSVVTDSLVPLLVRREGLSNEYVGQVVPLKFQMPGITFNHKIICYFNSLCELNPSFAHEMCLTNPGFCPDTTSCKRKKG